jgi:hypothetical protein
MHAYFAFSRGLPEQESALIRCAFYYESLSVKKLFEESAWRLFERGLEILTSKGDRASAREYWERVITRFPGSRYEEQCSSYVRILDRMLKEDSVFNEPKNLKDLSPDQQVAYWIHRLREVNAIQLTQPGSCRVLDDIEGHKDDAAHHLAQLGITAIPQLIGLLEDSRLTRSYGLWRDFSPWRWVLQYRDAAIEIIEHIAGETFYQASSSSSYLSNEKPAVQDAVITKVKAWWEKHKNSE